jgi:prolyl 4-hydroxylase
VTGEVAMLHNDSLEKETGIFVFDNLVPDKYCDKFLDGFKANKEHHVQGRVGRGDYDPDLKITMDWEVPFSYSEYIMHYYNIVWNEVAGKYPVLSGLGNTNLEEPMVMYYKKGEGRFKPHIDASLLTPNKSRLVVVILYLNDVEEGGDTYFLYQDVSVAAKKGRIVAFPATWKYFHEGRMPLSNDRYILTTFFSFYNNLD